MRMRLFTAFTACTLTACLLAVNATAAVVTSKDVRSIATWDTAFDVTTMVTATGTTTIAVGATSTTGLGQSFTANETGNIDAISFGVTRMYAGRVGQVNVYQMFDGDGTSDATPGANPTRFRNGNLDWMSDAIGSFTFDTNAININNSGDGNTMYTFSLDGADMISVVDGGTYMVQITGDAGNDTANNSNPLMLWDKNDSNPYAAGIYGVPLGGTTAAGRDAMLAVNITAAAVPEPSAFAGLGLGIVGLAIRRRRKKNSG